MTLQERIAALRAKNDAKRKAYEDSLQQQTPTTEGKIYPELTLETAKGSVADFARRGVDLPKTFSREAHEKYFQLTGKKSAHHDTSEYKGTAALKASIRSAANQPTMNNMFSMGNMNTGKVQLTAGQDAAPRRDASNALGIRDNTKRNTTRGTGSTNKRLQIRNVQI